jgi:ribosomal protein L36
MNDPEKQLAYVQKRRKVRVENEENPKRYVNLVLPINEYELDDIIADMLGRTKDGYVLDHSSVRWYYTLGSSEINDIFEENQVTMDYHKLQMPRYQYGENMNVFKENGEKYRGTINSEPRHKVRKGTL